MTVDSGSRSQRSIRGRLLSGGLWALAGKVLMGVLVIATNAVLARILSPAELGGYFLAFSLISIAATIAPLGLNRSIVRFIAESVGAGQWSRVRTAIRHAVYFGISGSLALASAMYLGFGDWLAREVVRSTPLADSVGLISVWIIPAALTLLFAEIFRGFHDIRGASIHGGLFASALALAAFVAAYLFDIRTTLNEVVGVSLVSAMIGVAAGTWALRRRIHRLPPESSLVSMRISTTLKASLPLFVTIATALVLSQADLWVLGIFKAQQDVAIYAAASKLMIVVSIPLVIVNAVIQPLIAEYYSQHRCVELQRLLRVSAALAALPAIAISFCAIFLAPPILETLYGSEYIGGAEVLIILAMGQVVNVWTGSCGIVLMMTGHERQLMLLTLSTSVLSVILMVALAEPWGINGVAVGSAAGIAVQNVAMWIATRRLAGLWTNMGVRGMGEVLRMFARDALQARWRTTLPPHC